MDELIKRLRICPNYKDGCVNCPHEHDLGCRTTTMHEAADAIEKLTAYVQLSEELREDGWYLQKNENDDLRTGYHDIAATRATEGGGISMNSVAIDTMSQIGTSCQICDSFIPIINIEDGYPRICDECKRRLKKLLYESPEEE